MGVLPQAFLLPSLMLTGLQKSPTSFDSFEKDSSPGSDGTTSLKTRVGARQLGRVSQGNNQASKLPFSERWISAAHEVIVRLILPWPVPGVNPGSSRQSLREYQTPRRKDRDTSGDYTEGGNSGTSPVYPESQCHKPYLC